MEDGLVCWSDSGNIILYYLPNDTKYLIDNVKGRLPKLAEGKLLFNYSSKKRNEYAEVYIINNIKDILKVEK